MGIKLHYRRGRYRCENTAEITCNEAHPAERKECAQLDFDRMNGIHQCDDGEVFLKEREVDIIEVTATKNDAARGGGLGAFRVRGDEGFAGIQVRLPGCSAAGSTMANGDLRGKESATARSPRCGSDRPFENF